MMNDISYIKQNILGIGFNLVSYEDVLKTILYWKENQISNYVTLTNPFCVTRCLHDNEVRDAISNSGMTLPDGIGIIHAARLFNYADNGRISGPELMLKLCDWGREYGFGHYFYGGAEGVAEKLAEKLMAKYPGLKVSGTYCPPFRTLSREENQMVIDKINSVKPDVVWIGLGAPKQEKWMAHNCGLINSAVMIGVGAAFDFHSGSVKWAPKMIQKMGMEGIYYVVFRPRRTLPKLYGTSLFTVLSLKIFLKQKIRKIISV